MYIFILNIDGSLTLVKKIIAFINKKHCCLCFHLRQYKNYSPELMSNMIIYECSFVFLNNPPPSIRFCPLVTASRLHYASPDMVFITVYIRFVCSRWCVSGLPLVFFLSMGWTNPHFIFFIYSFLSLYNNYNFWILFLWVRLIYIICLIFIEHILFFKINKSCNSPLHTSC